MEMSPAMGSIALDAAYIHTKAEKNQCRVELEFPS